VGPLSRSILALAVALTAASVAGCDAGDPRSCTVSCGALGECPDGTSCGTDSYCHAADEDPASCLLIEPDAAPVEDAGSRVDASIRDGGVPDANVIRPDACSGFETFAEVRFPQLVIPDADPVGVSSVIQVDDGCVVIDTVEITLDITHTFRGDLAVDLTAPNGDTIRVFTPSNDSTDDIHALIPVAIARGENASGTWLLEASDGVVGDTGSLDRWSLGINRPAP
jgi:hypothetical protein